MDNVLQAMTLFVLRTLILPLLFLYLLIKGLRFIWRQDWLRLGAPAVSDKVPARH